MSQSLRLEHTTSLVTGGARGIGFAIAKRLSGEGSRVIVADLDIDEAERAVDHIGGNSEALPVDIGSDEAVGKLKSQVEERHGAINILVNNAAILDATGFLDMDMSDYLRVININQHGAIRVTHAMHALMRRSEGIRRIVNIASIMGMRGSPDSIPYSTAKGAIVNFTRALACDLAPEGINVNAIAPGFIDTNMALLPDGSGHEHQTDWFKDIYLRYGRIPLRRAGVPEDIAGPAYFLCSPDSQYVTGQILLVDGGVSATF